MDKYTKLIAGEDDVFTVKKFATLVKCGGFVDYDGYGHPVKNSKICEDITVKPSKLDKIPKDATHVIWYNN